MKSISDASTRLIFLAGTAIPFLLVAPAYAQPGATGASMPTAPAPPPRDVTQDQAVSEVIVTAQRREERLQSVPTAVVALSGAQLADAGITSSRDLNQVTPSLVFKFAGNQPQIQVRGVGTRGSGPGDEPAVPIYIDGVYQAAQLNSSFQLSDISRVEILKGPQGTLFGRNAEGGAINVLTEEPGQEFKLRASGGYASYNQRYGDVYLAGPISSNVGASISIHSDADDGYIRNVNLHTDVGNADSFNVRSKVIWTPSPILQFTGIGWYGRQVDNASQSQSVYLNDSVAFAGAPPYNGGPVLLNQRASLPDHTAGAFPSLNRTVSYGAAAIGRYSFPGFDLTATASYQSTDNTDKDDLIQSYLPLEAAGFLSFDKDYTAEVRATSTGSGPFKWIGGFFFFDSRSGYDVLDINGTLLGYATVTAQNEQHKRSYAGFAEGTYNFGSHWDLTAGFRYSTDSDDNAVASGYINCAAGAFAPPVGSHNCPLNGVPLGYGPNVVGPAAGNPTQPLTGSGTFDNFSPRVTVKYAFNRDNSLYATYTTGFKSGLFNASTLSSPLVPVSPETVDAYEVGLKTKPLPTLLFDLEGYYYSYDNLQVSVRAPTGISQLENAAEARIYGGEAQIQWSITKDWRFGGGVSWTDSEFVRFPNAIVYTPYSVTAPPSTSAPTCGAAPVTLASHAAEYNGVTYYNGNNTVSCFNAKGKQVPGTPPVTLDLRSQYTMSIGRAGQIVWSGNFYFSDNYYFDFNNAFGTGAFTLLNLSARWDLPGGHTKFTAYCENCMNTHYIDYFNEAATGFLASWNRPLVIGGKVQYEF